MTEFLKLLFEGARLAKEAGDAELERQFQEAAAHMRSSGPDLLSDYAAKLRARERSDADELTIPDTDRSPLARAQQAIETAKQAVSAARKLEQSNRGSVALINASELLGQALEAVQES